MVVTSEGSFYQYNIDLENGGECVLLKQYRYGCYTSYASVHKVATLLTAQIRLHSLLEEPSDDMNTGVLD
jgi:hypothetical protein